MNGLSAIAACAVILFMKGDYKRVKAEKQLNAERVLNISRSLPSIVEVQSNTQDRLWKKDSSDTLISSNGSSEAVARRCRLLTREFFCDIWYQGKDFLSSSYTFTLRSNLLWFLLFKYSCLSLKLIFLKKRNTFREQMSYIPESLYNIRNYMQLQLWKQL